MGDFATEWETPEFDSVPTLAENMVYLLPGCDSVLIRKALQAAYRDFCRRSAALRTWRRIPLAPGEMRYPVAPLLSGEIDCVTQVLWAHYRMPVRGWRVTGDNPPMLELPHGSVRHDIAAEEPPVVYVQEHENTGAVPAPAGQPVFSAGEPHRKRHAILVEAVEIPHIGEERATKTFLRRYGDAVADGALARLFSMSGKAWTDAEQARQHAVAYENAVADARDRSMNGGPAANAGGRFSLDMGGMI